MIGELVPIVLLPRFTTLVGANTFTTVPIDVSAFSGGTLTLWRGQLKGSAAPTFALTLQSSTDQIDWHDTGNYDPGANGSTEISVGVPRRWLRGQVVLTGTDPAVTCWCTGFMEKRVR